MTEFDADRWNALSAHLDEAFDLDAEGRAELLEKLRRQDPDLARDLEALLEEHAVLDREGFLSGAVSSNFEDSLLVGLSVGAYKLRSPLGSGGMGSVWLADRCDGRFEGVAAVKLLNASLVGSDGEARFRREATFLARLTHRHIAHLIDAGVTAVGQPYIILEHVDGERIDAFCDSRRLDIAARVRLFLQVLEAVGFAHANLIVHRDLKPANVLVTRDGQVKLLDFGIAKLTSAEFEAATSAPAAVTRTTESAMTPAYAAPEQVKGEPITTATDIYALGVVLYVLLTGQHPSGRTTMSAAEWVEAVVEVIPRRASEAAIGPGIDGGATASERAHARGEVPWRLARLLRGDLDNIVAKALKKAAGERYTSAQSFADDLRRYLNHEPVQARADSVVYRVGKFVRRHRMGVAASGLVLGLIGAGTAGIAWQAHEAERQRDAARLQLTRATAANEFATYLLSVAAPGGKKFTAGELLEQGEALVDKQFAGDDAMRAELLTIIGQQYLSVEEYEKATAVLTRALDVANRTGDPGLRATAACQIGLQKAFDNDIEAGKTLIEGALAALPQDPQYAHSRGDCLIQYSNLWVVASEADPAIARAREALAVFDGMAAPSRMKRLEAKSLLAFGLYLAHRLREADGLYDEITRAIEASGLDRTTFAAQVLEDQGVAHYHDDLTRAEPLLRKALAIRRAIDPPGVTAPTHTVNLANVLQRLGKYDEAEALLQETIRTARTQGVRGLELNCVMELSLLALDEGDLTRAEAELEKLTPLIEDPLFRARQRRARYEYCRARLSAARGNLASAREEFHRAIDLFQREPEKVTMFVEAWLGLARVELALGQPAEASTATQEALTLARSMTDVDAPSYLVGRGLVLQGEIERLSGSEAAARGSFRLAAQHLRTTLGADHPATLDAEREAASGG